MLVLKAVPFKESFLQCAVATPIDSSSISLNVLSSVNRWHKFVSDFSNRFAAFFSLSFEHDSCSRLYLTICGLLEKAKRQYSEKKSPSLLAFQVDERSCSLLESSFNSGLSLITVSLATLALIFRERLVHMIAVISEQQLESVNDRVGRAQVEKANRDRKERDRE